MRPAGRGARCQAFSGVVNRVGDRRRQDRLKQQAAALVYVAGEIVRVGQIVEIGRTGGIGDQQSPLQRVAVAVPQADETSARPSAQCVAAPIFDRQLIKFLLERRIELIVRRREGSVQLLRLAGAKQWRRDGGIGHGPGDG